MRLVDSHCHLDLLDISNQEKGLASVIEAATNKCIEHFLCVCVELKKFESMLTAAQDFSQVSFSVGQHPNDSVNETIAKAEELVSLAKHPRVVAIGETGLDYYRTAHEYFSRQQEAFRAHIRAARLSSKPLIIHTRDARADTLSILREEKAQEVGGVFHCFTEDWETARAGLDLGFYISFSGVVTFKNAESLREVAKEVPLDRVLIETDSPYLAPVPHRGKPNEPAYVWHTAEFLAALRGEDFNHFAEQTTKNFYQLFRIGQSS